MGENTIGLIRWSTVHTRNVLPQWPHTTRRPSGWIGSAGCAGCSSGITITGLRLIMRLLWMIKTNNVNDFSCDFDFYTTIKPSFSYTDASTLTVHCSRYIYNLHIHTDLINWKMSKINQARQWFNVLCKRFCAPVEKSDYSSYRILPCSSNQLNLPLISKLFQPENCHSMFFCFPHHSV